LEAGKLSTIRPMERNLLINQLQEACDLEEKFISEFASFFKEHVSDNYHLTDLEKDFVDKRIKVLFVDSKRHLGLFQSMLEKINGNKYLVL
jgi:hypothetical protein